MRNHAHAISVIGRSSGERNKSMPDSSAVPRGLGVLPRLKPMHFHMSSQNCACFFCLALGNQQQFGGRKFQALPSVGSFMGSSPGGPGGPVNGGILSCRRCWSVPWAYQQIPSRRGREEETGGEREAETDRMKEKQRKYAKQRKIKKTTSDRKKNRQRKEGRKSGRKEGRKEGQT